MNTNLKKALLIFGGGFILFLAFKKIKPVGSIKGKKSTSSSKSEKTFTDEEKKNAAIVLSAFKAAQKAGEPTSFLNQMNVEFASQYSMKVFPDKSTGGVFVADLEGNKIL